MYLSICDDLYSTSAQLLDVKRATYILQRFAGIGYSFYDWQISDRGKFTSCFRSSSDSPAQRQRCCSNSQRVVLVTTATFSGVKAPAGCDELLLLLLQPGGCGGFPLRRRRQRTPRLPAHSSFNTARPLMFSADLAAETHRGGKKHCVTYLAKKVIYSWLCFYLACRPTQFTQWLSIHGHINSR